MLHKIDEGFYGFYTYEDIWNDEAGIGDSGVLTDCSYRKGTCVISRLQSDIADRHRRLTTRLRGIHLSKQEDSK